VIPEHPVFDFKYNQPNARKSLIIPPLDMRRPQMLNETDLSNEKNLFYQRLSETVIKNLQRRNINGYYSANRGEALKLVMDMIPPGASVVRADSLTVDEVGILDAIEKRNENRFINPLKTDPDGFFLCKGEERARMEREAFSADIFITGSNAITLDGKIVNTDGWGNRVAPMLYGPNKVILVMGANKIVNNEEEARERIHNLAAPMNAIRHYSKHNLAHLGDLACVRTGKCVDCSSEARICRYTVIIEGVDTAVKGRINVVLVGEDLGI
jgi:hypothetical protein